MKVGDYVRTKDNKIYKIIDKKFDETILIDLYQTDISGYLMEIDIKKSSPSIIDLIEVGDYVNGYEIIDIIYEKDNIKYLETEITKFDNVYPIGNVNIYKNDIKSILTKEQFENMKYRIGE